MKPILLCCVFLILFSCGIKSGYVKTIEYFSGEISSGTVYEKTFTPAETRMTVYVDFFAGENESSIKMRPQYFPEEYKIKIQKIIYDKRVCREIKVPSFEYEKIKINDEYTNNEPEKIFCRIKIEKDVDGELKTAFLTLEKSVTDKIKIGQFYGD